MSIVFDFSGLALAKSSSSTTTYLPLAYWKPFTISFQGTSLPVLVSILAYRIGAMSFLDSMSKSSPSEDSTALFNFTGIFTRPKLMAPDQMERIIQKFTRPDNRYRAGSYWSYGTR